MSSPTVDKFLLEIARILHEKDGIQLQDFMLLEPPLPPLYKLIVNELRQSFLNASQDDFEAKCRSYLPEHEDGDEGGSWLSFMSFTAKYFAFLRDVDENDLVETHELLKGLLKLVLDRKNKLH